MITADLATAAEWMGGRLAQGAARDAFRGVSTDSRTLEAGNLFVALAGPNHDGHAHCAQAVARGAAAVVVSRAVEVDAPEIRVGDPLVALGALARAWRARFTGPLIAVTGSNGKTTVKECIAAILRRRGPALATRGNLNNEIGLPLTLCELDPAHHGAAVVELGSNHPGEIAYLARIARPGVGVVINSDAAHLEGFGTVEAVAAGNAELLAELPAEGTAVFPLADPFVELYRRESCAGHGLDFAADREAPVQVRAANGGIELVVGEAVRTIDFVLAGAHNRHNAAAAAAGALAAGFDVDAIAAGLADVAPVPGRLVLRDGAAGATLLDDTYNANPGSFRAALELLAETRGRRWAVVGEMAELGAGTAAAHRRLGEDLRAAGVERLWAFGPSAAETCSGHGGAAEPVEDLADLGERLAQELAGDVTLLVKGSRSNRLERLLERLGAGTDRPAEV